MAFEFYYKKTSEELSKAIIAFKEKYPETKNNNYPQELTKIFEKYIEVYEIHGTFPKSYLDKEAKATEFSNQFHIVCFYQKQNQKDKSGVTLFSMLCSSV